MRWGAKRMASEHNTDLALLNDLLWPTERTHTDRPHDRVVAIVCVSYVEKYLAALIQAHMPGAGPGLRTKLFKPEGARGPIGVKVDIAKCLDLIDQRLSDDIKKMASIRNLFAHRLDIESFDHPEVAKYFDAMQIIGLNENMPGNSPFGKMCCTQPRPAQRNFARRDGAFASCYMTP